MIKVLGLAGVLWFALGSQAAFAACAGGYMRILHDQTVDRFAHVCEPVDLVVGQRHIEQDALHVISNHPADVVKEVVWITDFRQHGKILGDEIRHGGYRFGRSILR